jgi:hypothetical protein
MKRYFLNHSDRVICITLIKMMTHNMESLKFSVSQKQLNTSLWNASLKHTLLGQLIDEVIDRQITKEYFIAVARMR